MIFLQILHAGNSRFEKRGKFFQNFFKNKKHTRSYIKTLQMSSGWNTLDCSILPAMEFYVSPEAFIELSPFMDINSLSEWEHWDGWLKHTYEENFFGSYSRYIYTITNEGKLTEYSALIKEDAASPWENWDKNLFTYNANGNITNEIIYDWDDIDSTWVNSMKRSYTYNASGTLTEGIIYEWDTDWVEYEKATYHFNATAKIDEIKLFSIAVDDWVEYGRILIDYGANGKIAGFVYYDYEYESGDKTVFNYNTSNKITDYTSYLLDVADSTWLPDYHVTMSYDPNGDYGEVITQEMDTEKSTWIYLDKFIYTYDVNKNMSDETVFYWSDEALGWVSSTKTVYSYNTRNNPENFIGYEWNESTLQWDLVEYTATITYEYINSIIPSNFTGYLNPLMQVTNRNGNIQVHIDGRPGKSDAMKVYDLHGRLIYSMKPVWRNNKNVYTWDISDKNNKTTSPRVYLLAVKQDEKLLTQKVILSR